MPTSEELFRRAFAPVYPPGALADMAAMRATDANPGKNPSILAELDDTAEVFARLAPGAFGRDDLGLDFTDASVHRLSAALGRTLRDRWLEPAEAGAPPLIVNVATHGAAYVGACVVRGHGATWQVRRPLWESVVRLESRAGIADLSVFSWWLRSLGDEEIDDPRLADRYRAHVEMPTLRPEALPLICPPDRKIPRLAKVRYSALHQHLRAHLPEMKSLGDDFPSPERLEELEFRWLEFILLGGGRMLLIHGPSRSGVHLFWLDLAGFVKSAYYAADGFPAHVVQLDGDKLRVVLPIGKETRVHEMLWWGV